MLIREEKRRKKGEKSQPDHDKERETPLAQLSPWLPPGRRIVEEIGGKLNEDHLLDGKSAFEVERNYKVWLKYRASKFNEIERLEKRLEYTGAIEARNILSQINKLAQLENSRAPLLYNGALLL